MTTTTTKTYSTASNARRAAKQAGLTLDLVEILNDGFSVGRKFWFQTIPVEDVTGGEHFHSVTEEEHAAHRGEVPNKSTIERPCQRVWIIADDMLVANPSVKRKDVMAACVAAGVAFYTARTQYQQWIGVRKEMAAREAAAKSK